MLGGKSPDSIHSHLNFLICSAAILAAVTTNRAVSIMLQDALLSRTTVCFSGGIVLPPVKGSSSREQLVHDFAAHVGGTKKSRVAQ